MGNRGPDISNLDIENTMIIAVNGVAKLRHDWLSDRLGNCQSKVSRSDAQCQGSNYLLCIACSPSGGWSFKRSAEHCRNLRLTFENNRTVIVQELKSFNGVHLIPPQGTFYALPDFSGIYNTSLTKICPVAAYLLKKAIVVTVPGKEFGMEGHIRLSFAGGMKDVHEGIERIKWVLDPSSPSEMYIGDRKLVRDWL